MPISRGPTVRTSIRAITARPAREKTRSLWLSAILVGTLCACAAGSAPAPDARSGQAWLAAARSAQASVSAAPLAAAQDGCSARSFLPVYPDERPDPFTTRVALLSVLFDRLTAAQSAFQMVRDAADPGTVRCGAQATLDLLLGSRGRNRSPSVLVGGALPGDTPSLVDPGLALAAHDSTLDSRIREAISAVLLGDVESWGQPSRRWDEIDAAVAGWTPGNDLSSLDGGLMRLIGWARLALRAPTISVANQIGAMSLRDVASALQATTEALIATCEDAEEPLCEYGL